MLPLAFSFFFVYHLPVYGILCLGLGVPIVVPAIIGWTTGALQDIKHGPDGQAIEPGYGIKAMLLASFLAVIFVILYITRTSLYPVERYAGGSRGLYLSVLWSHTV